MFRCNIPESPEVKLSTDLIRPFLENKTINNIFIYKSSKFNRSGIKNLNNIISTLPIKINKVSCHGKQLYWELSNNYYLFSHFGMSGSWAFQEDKHSAISLSFDETEEKIYFNDTRHFGNIEFVNKVDFPKHMKKLGWDPFKEDYSKYEKHLKQILKNTNTAIASLLLEQNFIAGVGNYIRAEALYASKLSPFKAAKQVTEAEFDLLAQNIITVMKESYAHQGATFKTYKDAFGASGQYSSLFKVYDQKTDPLGNPVKKLKTIEGRMIHYVPEIQK